MSIQTPFAVEAEEISLLSLNPTLKKVSETLRGVSRYSKISFFVVDLTTRARMADGTRVGFSFFGENNASTTRYAASCVKVAAMVAAFRLLASVLESVRHASFKNEDELIKQLTAEWKPKVESTVKGAPKDFPNLKKIFRFTGVYDGWWVTFSDTYWHHLVDMVSWSKNESSSYCIRALGYQWIAGTMISEGLYSPGEGGLWLAGDYGAGRDGIPEPKSKSYQAANAVALAKMLILIDSGRLIGPKPSATMRELMMNSWTKEILSKEDGSVLEHFGKLGIGVDGTYHDAAIIARKKGAKSVRYAVVILGSHGFSPLSSLVRYADDLIFSIH